MVALLLSNHLLFTVCEWWGGGASPTRLAPVYIRTLMRSHMLTTRPVEFWAREFCWKSRKGLEFSIRRWISLLCQECCRTTPPLQRKCCEIISLWCEREREKAWPHSQGNKRGKQLAIFHTGYTFTIDYSRTVGRVGWVLLDFLQRPQPIRPSAPLS